jgi:hypothetical protein
LHEEHEVLDVVQRSGFAGVCGIGAVDDRIGSRREKGGAPDRCHAGEELSPIHTGEWAG